MQEFPGITVREWVVGVTNRDVMEAYDGGLIFLLFMDSEWLERDLGRVEVAKLRIVDLVETHGVGW